jgi:molybdopterin-guanine dinucleotide biosynthesis protein A
MLTVILTGGKSSRMGQDKALLPHISEGRCIRDELALRYAVLGPVAVSVSQAGQYDGGALELPDAFPGQGPINGLYAAFTMTDAERVFLTATDIVNGDAGLARHLEARLEHHSACVIRREKGDLEPLFAVYTRRCFMACKLCLSAGKRSMLDMIKMVDAVFVEESDLRGMWNLDDILLNINTPKDYERFKASGL